MDQDHRLGIAIANLEQKLVQIKRTIEELLVSLELPDVAWADMMSKFCSLASSEFDNVYHPTAEVFSELTSIQRALLYSAIPSGQQDHGQLLKTRLLVPQRVSLDVDPYLMGSTQGRLPSWNHESAPNYLRTKLNPEAESDSAALESERTSQRNPDTVTKQISSLNKHIENLSNQLSSESSFKMAEKRRDRPSYSNQDTLTLVRAITRGVGIQARQGVSGSASDSRPPSTVVAQQPMGSLPAALSSSATNVASTKMPSKGQAARDVDDVEGDETPVEKDKHRWDAADLEKVTDFHEDGDEMNEVSRESLGSLKASTQPTQTQKIVIRKEDVQLIVDELEVPRAYAERKLLQFDGDVKGAMKSIINFS